MKPRKKERELTTGERDPVKEVLKREREREREKRPAMER